MNITQSYLTKNPCYTAGKTITVKGLMLHSVGCAQPSAAVFIKSWNKSTYTSACVHGFIDADTGTIYQTLPWNRRGWHCGSGSSGSANNTHIGVEMCEPAEITYTSGTNFTVDDKAAAQAAAKRTYDAAVELFAYLCKEYGLDPTASGVILSHKEGHAKGIASNHGDPEHLWKGLGLSYTMDAFRTAVKKKMGSTATTSSKPTYKVGNVYTTQVDKLNVRKGPATSYSKVAYADLTANAQANAYAAGQLKKGTKVTCKAVKAVGSDIWLQIPSGWIAAYYSGKIYVK